MPFYWLRRAQRRHSIGIGANGRSGRVSSSREDRLSDAWLTFPGPSTSPQPASRRNDFHDGALLCSDLKVEMLKSPKPNPGVISASGVIDAGAGSGDCTVDGSGTIGVNALGVGAYCGASGGIITGTFTASNGTFIDYTMRYDTGGSVMALQGTGRNRRTGQSGPLVSVGIARPAGSPTSLPCFLYMERYFVASGVAVIRSHVTI